MEVHEFHPVAEIFSLIEGPEFQGLVEDIQENGLLEEIELFDGKIIDGRNRYRACIEADIEPKFSKWEGEEKNLISYIISKNLRRRQLNESQKALVGAKMKPVFEAKAKERQGSRKDISADRRGSSNRKSSEEIAKVVNGSARLIERAIRVLAKGAPELILQVESGGMRLEEAVKVSDKPQDEQLRLLAMTKDERARELKPRKMKTQGEEEQNVSESKTAEPEGVKDTKAYPDEPAPALSKISEGQEFSPISGPTRRINAQEIEPCAELNALPKKTPTEEFEALSEAMIEIVRRGIPIDLIEKHRRELTAALKEVEPQQQPRQKAKRAAKALAFQKAAEEPLSDDGFQAQEPEVVSDPSNEPDGEEALIAMISESNHDILDGAEEISTSPPVAVAAPFLADDVKETAEDSNEGHPSCFGVNPYVNWGKGECKKKGCQLFNDCCEKYNHPGPYSYSSSRNQRG